MPGYKKSVEIDSRTISIETGNWAKQAHGSVVYRSGNLVLLATVCADREAREGQDFFPLTVDYREKFYAAGRIPGGYFKRENRPADHETLMSRMIDRPIRPLFPTGYFSEVQLLITMLSADEGTSVEGHALTAASAAIACSDIPFHGPIAGVVVARIDGKLVADPALADRERGDLELIVAGSENAITMIEGGANEFTNEQMLEALQFAHDNIKKKLSFQTELGDATGVTKRELSLRLPDEALMKEVREFAFEKLKAANQNTDKIARGNQIREVNKETVAHFEEKLIAAGVEKGKLEQSKKDIKHELHEIEYEVVRNNIFENNKRSDGRAPDEIRDISVELDVLPGAHGSAVFTRGQTQALGVLTLGTGSDGQRYETVFGQQQKNFLLHYNFPPYSVGEVKRMMGPGRREIGHGNLAWRALSAVLPAQEEFPYVIRLVAEIMESNGSSSMATVCSGSLAMMAGGVPVKAPVSGIAMGMFTSEDGKYSILSDIAGIEDHFGDMDFKVAGTEKGITAFQLDLKLTGITIERLREALDQAEKGRMHILNKMNEALNATRENLAPSAPRIKTIKIDQDRIGELIGPGGKIIRAIIEKTGADISVEDDGSVSIASPNQSSLDAAQVMVEDIFRELNEGDSYDGVVKRIAEFGAFVELFPGKEGLLHVSKMSEERVSSVSAIYKEGDIIPVVVMGVDRQGRVDLIHKDLHGKPGFSSRGGGGGDRGGDRGGRGGDRGRGGPRGGGDRGRR
ncbi:MAG: polyribonucleotide nucleotidyltransferase [bacterium]|nr:polyribonucleotide nucleotidyltransferase [bacterium]